MCVYIIYNKCIESWESVPGSQDCLCLLGPQSHSRIAARPPVACLRDVPGSQTACAGGHGHIPELRLDMLRAQHASRRLPA